jgi:hypothetical protein
LIEFNILNAFGVKVSHFTNIIWKIVLPNFFKLWPGDFEEDDEQIFTRRLQSVFANSRAAEDILTNERKKHN